MIDAFDHAFLTAIDDLNAGRLHDDPEHYLRMVPAAVRFISAEPLLGPLEGLELDDIHWLIAGGESGHRRRPVREEWMRQLRDRCQAEQVAFFLKQWGGRTPKAGGRLLDGVEWSEMPVIRASALA